MSAPNFTDAWWLYLYAYLILLPFFFKMGMKLSKELKGDLRTICRFSYIKVYKLITLGTKFKTLLSLGRKITMFSKFITNYIEQGWWHSSLTLKCMHLLLKKQNLYLLSPPVIWKFTECTFLAKIYLRPGKFTESVVSLGLLDAYLDAIPEFMCTYLVYVHCSDLRG